MENANLIGILQRHGENDYSIWHPNIPADDPTFNALLDKHADNGCSVRGSAKDTAAEIMKSLHIDTCRRAHVLMYHEPKIGYVGVDVFATYQGARKQFLRLLEDVKAEHAEDADWIEELVCLEANDDSLYFRDKDGYEVVYSQEIIQNDERKDNQCDRM